MTFEFDAENLAQLVLAEVARHGIKPLDPGAVHIGATDTSGNLIVDAIIFASVEIVPPSAPTTRP